MIKRQLNPLRIGKGLLSLVALSVMLLAPQRAWAQTDYGLTVAGVTVTSDNATNITGQNILAGTVTYEDGSHTLTLDHATINGSVVVTGGFDLVVCLVGDNTIQGTGETSLANGISRGGGSAAGKLTFDIAKNTSGSLFFPYVTTPIAGFANIEYLNGLEWGCRDEGTTTDYVEGVGTEVVLASIGASLYVTKTKTTMTLSNNGGTVTYRKDDTLGHVLTLSGLTDLNNCISWYSPDDVKIEISGTNNSMSFSSSGTYNSVCFEGKPQSNISFRFTGATATLKMYDRSQYKSLEHPWISGFNNASNPTLSDGLKMVEIDEYRYDSQDNQTKHVERYITTETYGLNVQGIQVHNLEGVNVGHKDNILGLVYNEQSEKWELSTSVTFNSDDNILTLNNANINYDDGNAIVSSITSPLTVHLTGENFISSGDYLPFVGAIGDNANLVFTTNTTGTPGSLTMTSTHTDFGPTSFFDGFKLILYPEEQGLLAAKSVNGNVVISQETGYGLKVAGIVVTEDNASHILGENNTTVTFTPATEATGTEPAKPATLTLSNATISGIIETSKDLTVDFKGASSINLPNGDDYAFVGKNSPVLSFTNSGKNSSPLTVNGEFNGGNTKFMNGFAQESVDVDINEDRDNATVWWLESTVSAHMYLRWIEKYDLWIGDTQFTNIDSELSGGKGSFDGDHTLTLNGASLTAPIKSNLDNLTIKLKGNNSIVETSDSATLINSYKKTATLSFDVDNELGGSLTLTNRGDGASIKNFTSVSLAEGLYIHSNQAGLRYETINNEKCYVAQQNCDSWTMTINQNASYPIWVYKNSTDGYVQITETNKANVLGEQTETKSVTYDDGTLTLNSATINSGTNYAFVMGDNMTALNVVLVGVNTVTGNGFQFTTSSPSLTFKTNGTATGSLAIVDAQNTNYSLATTTVAGGSVTPTYENGLAYTAEAKTVGLPSLGLTIGNTVVTSANKDDVFDGDENLDGKVSFNPQNNTLTLNDANLQTSSLVSTLSNLKVKFNNGCHLKEIVSNNSDATLSFELADNSGEGSYICFYSANAWTGFSADPTLSKNLAYMPNVDTKFIRKVFTPIMAIMDGQLVFKDLYNNNIYSGDFSAFECHYTIDYVDNTPQQATGVYTSDSNIQLEHPCTVTAWLTYTDGLSRSVQGANAVGKLFGFEENEIDGVIGTKVDLPAIIPTIAETDGVTIIYEGNVSDNNTKVDLTSQTSVGNTTVIASLTGSNQTSYTLLNSNFSLTVNIVPPAPTISTAEFEGDAITITAAEGLTNPQIYYSWDEEQDGTSYTQTPPTAKNGTLYAWVTIADGGKSYTSPKTERTFTVKKNLANAYVQMTTFVDRFTTYTDSSITPTFVVKESENADAPTIASTNYDVTYQYKSANANEYSDVTEIKNVGNYKIVITGKGEAYGGSQEIEFQVEKASITDYAQWASPAAKEGLTYTGEKQGLVTAGTVPTGVTIKYYVADSADANPYQEEGGWSAEIPERQEIGTYYIFCKADASENYEAWPAGDDKVCLTVSIEMGTATLTATDQTSEYTGEPIEYSKDHVTVNPSTVSKENVFVEYYIPDPDHPNDSEYYEELEDDAPTEVGTYIVRFYLEDDNYILGEEEYTATLTITPKGITADMVTLSEESFTYNGSPHTPNDVSVSYTVGQTTKTLSAGTDYDLSYQLSGTTNNVENPTNAGTYNVVVEGKGNYSGTATKSFAINPASIEDYTVSVDDTQTYTYTGSAIRPSVTVTIPNVGTLDAANYTVSYENNVNAADENATNKPTVIVTGIGNYTGTTTANFTINKADITGLTVSKNEGLVYDGTEQDLVTVSNVPSGATVKYYFKEIDEEDFEDGSFNMISESNDNDYTTYLPTGTNAGYFGIVYMVDGGNNYNKIEATATMKVAIYPAEITSVTLDKTSMAYTGTAQTVTITSVKAGTDDSLDVPSTGYTVTLDGVTVTGDITAKDVKEYTVAVTGNGNFTGTVSATFTIVNRTLAAEDVTFNNHWSTFYSADGAYELPEGIGAYVATGAGENSVTVTQISNIPEKVAVLLNNATTTTTTNVYGTDVKGNYLQHATVNTVVDAEEGDYYGLYNGAFMRITDKSTIPAGKNYLLIPAAVNVNAGASQLTIVIDGETTDVNDVRSKMEDVRGDIYDLQGRKVQKPSKKGLYINKGHKVVVK